MINPGARLIYSLVSPEILSIQLLDPLLRIQSYQLMINWLLTCLTPQHTRNTSAENHENIIFTELFNQLLEVSAIKVIFGGRR